WAGNDQGVPDSRLIRRAFGALNIERSLHGIAEGSIVSHDHDHRIFGPRVVGEASVRIACRQTRFNQEATEFRVQCLCHFVLQNPLIDEVSAIKIISGGSVERSEVARCLLYRSMGSAETYRSHPRP